MNMNSGTAIAVTSLASLAAGSIAGYFVASHILRKKLAQELQQEIEATKTFYAMKYKKDEFETPEKAAEALGTPVVKVEMTPVDDKLIVDAARALVGYNGGAGVRRNVFQQRVIHDDPSEADLRARTEEAPYVISYTEFQVNEQEFDQVTLEWYTADAILVDEKDEVVADPDDLVGDDNLEKFGYLSGDPRTVYVRNDAKRLVFEIVMNDNSYATVLGMKD